MLRDALIAALSFQACRPVPLHGRQKKRVRHAPAPAPAPPDEPAQPRPRPATAADESKYQLIDVTSARFRLVGQKYNANSGRTDEGIKPNGGTVGRSPAGGDGIELASDKFENRFIVTKEYGKIKIRFTEGMAVRADVFTNIHKKGSCWEDLSRRTFHCGAAGRGQGAACCPPLLLHGQGCPWYLLLRRGRGGENDLAVEDAFQGADARGLGADGGRGPTQNQDLHFLGGARRTCRLERRRSPRARLLSSRARSKPGPWPS